jgi:broad specificity phosphatase PhoE
MKATVGHNEVGRTEVGSLAVAVILVRHSSPRVVKDVSPTLWALSEEGSLATARLAERLAAYQPTALAASPERKAEETARIIAERLSLCVVRDEGFVEHRRPSLAFGTRADFEASIRRVFDNPSERFFGGESADEAHARFEKALDNHTGRPLAVVTHGTVLTLFVSRKAGLDPMTLWTSLKLPEALVLDTKMQLLARLAV